MKKESSMLSSLIPMLEVIWGIIFVFTLSLDVLISHCGASCSVPEWLITLPATSISFVVVFEWMRRRDKE